MYSGCVATNPRPCELTPVIVDTARMVLPDALTIPARAVTSVTSTVEKSAMTQPPTQVFAQQRRSGCGTLLVALLVLAIITAIVIFLGAFGLLGWIQLTMAVRTRRLIVMLKSKVCPSQSSPWRSDLRLSISCSPIGR